MSGAGPQGSSAPPPEEEAAVGQEEERRERSPLSGIAAGYTLLGSIAVGLLIGWSIDVWADTAPLWTALMSVLFIAAGLYHLVRDHWPQD
ncbi:MAG: AtpZ/AtpI family protein [Planctomycetota bacterium]